MTQSQTLAPLRPAWRRVQWGWIETEAVFIAGLGAAGIRS
jgi:hypothetical protein